MKKSLVRFVAVAITLKTHHIPPISCKTGNWLVQDNQQVTLSSKINDHSKVSSVNTYYYKMKFNFLMYCSTSSYSISLNIITSNSTHCNASFHSSCSSTPTSSFTSTSHCSITYLYQYLHLCLYQNHFQL